jgi:hypothetical protein
MGEESFEVIDNLLSESTSDALSANQGRLLGERVAALEAALENVATNADIDAIFAA